MTKSAIAMLCAVVLVAAGCGGDEPGQAQAASSGASAAQPLQPLTGGDPLPATALPVLGGQDGTVDMGDLGGPAVLNFWATWCAFCVEEMPALEQVHAEVAGRVRFIGIDVEDNADAARRLADETGVTYELVEDVDRSYFLAVKARGMPTTVFVTADGVIQYRHTGPLTAATLRELLQEHLGIAS